MIDKPVLKWSSSDDRGGGLRILVIHGMEFHSIDEVVTDLVEPISSIVSNMIGSPRAVQDLGYFHWDSRIDTVTGRKMFPVGAFFGNAVRMGKRLLHPEAFFSSLEARAMSAGETLADAVGQMLRRDTEARLLVISHSLGGLVWAEALRRLLDDAATSHRVGRWLNLQPAIAADRFLPRGCYGGIDRALGTNHTIFFSRYDCVLRGLFTPLAGRPALGQIGPALNMRARHADMSRVAFEAHGQTSLFPKLGGFLNRSRHKVATYFQEVCHG